MKDKIIECVETVEDMQNKVVYKSSHWWYLEGSKDAYNNMLEEIKEESK